MPVSVCIDVQVKGMPTRASWSGTDLMEQTLWNGEASHMVSERSLLFWTFKIMFLYADLQCDVTSIKCFGLMWFHFLLNTQGIFSSRITRGLTVLFLLRTFFKPMEFMYWTGQPSLPISVPWRIFGTSWGDVSTTDEDILRTSTNSKPRYVKNGATCRRHLSVGLLTTRDVVVRPW